MHVEFTPLPLLQALRSLPRPRYRNLGVLILAVSRARILIARQWAFFLFSSSASNLVVGDTNNTTDLFVLDRNTGAQERVSVTANGGSPNGSSGYTPAVSSDGRYVAYSSSADNLIPDDTNGRPDIFVRDRQLGFTERVSVANDGSQANDGRQQVPALGGPGVR